MKTLKKECEDVINMSTDSHPSRAVEERIKRLESLILKLAQRIDNLEHR